MFDNLVEAVRKCENSDPKKNRMGIMCWNKEGERYLCTLTPDEEKKEFKAILGRYIEKNGENITLERAIYIYSPKIENNTENHLECISKKSGISKDTYLVDILYTQKNKE
jgi:hypothetical protein